MNRMIQQLYYLLYKNLIFKWRNKRQTIMEMVAILYFVAILAAVRMGVRETNYEEITDADRTEYAMSGISKYIQPPLNRIGYVLKGNPSTSINIAKFIDTFSDASKLTMYEFRDEPTMDQFYKNNADNFTIGVIFDFQSEGNISYTIKTPFNSLPKATDSKISTVQTDCRDLGIINLYKCNAAKYLGTGFSSIQSFIDMAFIEVASNQSTQFTVNSKVQMFPKASYKDPLEYLKSIVGIYMVIAFSPYINFLLTNIVAEKEKKIKEAMKIMGLSMTAFWLSWFITYGLLILIGAIFTVVISAAVSLYGDSNYVIIFIILYLYGLSIITFSFMLTPLFKKARNAGFAGSMGTMLLSLVSLLHTQLDTSIPVKWLTCFLSPVALSLGLQSGLDFNDPLTWSNLSSKGDFPASNAILMLVIDTILYLLIAGYLDAVFPGEYGKAKSPFFIVTLSFWKKLFQGAGKPNLHCHSSLFNAPGHERAQHEDNEDIEKIPESMLDEKVISVDNLSKIFKQGKKKPDLHAVDGVSFDVYEGQITALLGHNGAGKSTLISILTGMLTPSGGDAEMYNLNLRDGDDMDEIRNIIGLCPQQNIIFDQLTPAEHLKLFAGIKGLSADQIKPLVDNLLVEIDLKDQADLMAKSLSGGQKRKLCVGIALIGDPKIVFLDEPTSGMDPSSRRQVWSLLQSKREKRVIFLTTHFMDEADILADYKIIMSKGKIRCAGSSLFLKSRFGIGYHLGMVLEKGTNSTPIEEVVTQKVPGAQLSRQHGKELAFRLPLSQVDKFPDLFEHFEQLNDSEDVFSVSQLGVNSYGVSMTTLEEVFLKLEEEEESEVEINLKNNGVNGAEASGNNLVVESAFDANSFRGSDANLVSSAAVLNPGEDNNVSSRKEVSWLTHLLALLEVRFWLLARSPLKIFFLGLLPPVLMIVGLIIGQNTSLNKDTTHTTAFKLDASLYLKQGNVGLFETLYKLDRPTDNVYMNKSFDSIDLDVKQVEQLELLKQAPHAIAYQIIDVDNTGKVGYNLRYNDSAIHSIPVGINTMSNAVYKEILNKQGKTLQPTHLPISVYSKFFESRKALWEFDYSAMMSTMLIGLAFISMIGSFSIESIMYRQLGIRHQLRVSGLNRLMYWIHFVIGDMLFFLIPCIVMYIGIAALKIVAFKMAPALFCIFILTLLYISSCLMFTYTFSFAFSNWETAQNTMPTVINMISLAPYFAVSILDLTSGEISGKPLHAQLAVGLALVDPPFTILAGLWYIGRIHRVESILQQNNDVVIPLAKYFEWSEDNALPAILLIMIFHLLVFSWSTYAIDCYKAGGTLTFPLSICNSLWSNKKKLAHTRSTVRSASGTSCNSARVVNEDVKKEKERVVQHILNDSVKDTSVLTQGLQKQFKDKVVVKDMNLLVERGEIFGILGPNGAGKTTTLNMITADIQPDKGQAYIDGYNIGYELEEAFDSLGYCPQVDALFPDLTLREHLKLYGLIKGVSKLHVNGVIERYATALKISEHLDKRSKELSGGTKRKLSFLISMIGSSSIIVMDEPSCGMDPSARRFLWSAISSNISGSKGAMLTTHSMEEADALCARVGIIVKGELKCVGTTQELKNNYGGGYQLEIKFKLADNETNEEAKRKVSEYVVDIFPRAEELEYFGSRITFKISTDQLKSLSQVFAKLEHGKRNSSIEEYSFSQSTLEQVFLEFAREQEESDNIDGDAPNSATSLNGDAIS